MAKRRKKIVKAPRKVAIKSGRNMILNCDQDETIVYGDPSLPKYNFMGGSCQITTFFSTDPRESGSFTKKGVTFHKDYYPIFGVYGIEPAEVKEDENLGEVDNINGVIRCESIVDSSDFIKRDFNDFNTLWQKDAKTSRELLNQKIKAQYLVLQKDLSNADEIIDEALAEVETLKKASKDDKSQMAKNWNKKVKKFNYQSSYNAYLNLLKDKITLESIIEDVNGRNEFEDAIASGYAPTKFWKNPASKYIRTPILGIARKEEEVMYSKKIPISSYIPKNWVDTVVKVCKEKIGPTSVYTKCKNADYYQYMLASDLDDDRYILRKSNLTKEEVIDSIPKPACIKAGDIKSERKEVKYPDESRSEILSFFEENDGDVEMSSKSDTEYMCQMKPVVEAPYSLSEEEASKRIESRVGITERGFLQDWKEKGETSMKPYAKQIRKGSKLPIYTALRLYNIENGSLNGAIDPSDINLIAQRDGTNCSIIHPKSSKFNKIGSVTFEFSGYKGDPKQLKSVIDGFAEIDAIGEDIGNAMSPNKVNSMIREIDQRIDKVDKAMERAVK